MHAIRTAALEQVGYFHEQVVERSLLESVPPRTIHGTEGAIERASTGGHDF